MVKAFPYGVVKHAECLLHDPLYEIAAGVVLVAHITRVLVVGIGMVHIKERHITVGTQMVP